MPEKNESIHHAITIDNRKSGTITGVTDIVSFDDKEIFLKTHGGAMSIKGTGLVLTRLDLDKQETDIQGNIDSIVYSKHTSKKIKNKLKNWW